MCSFVFQLLDVINTLVTLSNKNNHPVRLLVSARLIQPANSVFLSQQTSTSQPKPAQKPTSEQAIYYNNIEHRTMSILTASSVNILSKLIFFLIIKLTERPQGLRTAQPLSHRFMSNVCRFVKSCADHTAHLALTDLGDLFKNL